MAKKRELEEVTAEEVGALPPFDDPSTDHEMAGAGEPMAPIEPPSRVAVIMDRPGVRACGDYLAGEVYSVDPATAKRLIEVKGFRLALDSEV